MPRFVVDTGNDNYAQSFFERAESGADPWYASHFALDKLPTAEWDADYSVLRNSISARLSSGDSCVPKVWP
jgi:hypothetical protein